MKSYSISSFFFALNVFVSANPLVQRATFGGSSDNPLGSQTPNGDLLAPYNPPTTSEEGGEFCGVQLYEYTGTMKPRGRCTKGLSVAGGWWLFGSRFSADKERQQNDPNYHSDTQVQCCVEIQCTLSNGDDGYCTNSDKDCMFSTQEPGHCPGTNTKCCGTDAPPKPASSLPTFDLQASSDLGSVDLNALLPAGDLTFNPDDNNNNLFTIDDGSTFNPDDLSQISFGLTDSPLGDAGTTLLGTNDASEQSDLFASVEGGESALDLWS